MARSIKTTIKELSRVLLLPWLLAVACSDGVATPAGEPSLAAPRQPVSSAPSVASPDQAAALVVGAGAAPAVPAKAAANSVPVPMPGGGVRLDMRGSATNVRALEKQADGTYKQTCTDVPAINQPANQPVKP